MDYRDHLQFCKSGGCDNVAGRIMISLKIPVNKERMKACISKGREAFGPPKNFKAFSNHFIAKNILKDIANTKKKRPPPKPRLLNEKPPKGINRLEYDDKITSEEVVASSTEAENKKNTFSGFKFPKFSNGGSWPW